MRNAGRHMRWVLLCAAYVAGVGYAHAWAVSEDNPTADRWEFGVHTGIAFPFGQKSLSILGNNSVFLLSDPSEPGEDEFAENGLPSPDFTGQTRINGSAEPMAYVGGHYYYHLIPWVALGLEASAAIQRNEPISAAGPFGVPLYKTDYSFQGFQIAPTARIGDWIGPIRPYGMIGVGPYFWHERLTAELNDPDDTDHPALVAAQNDHTYTSTIFGGGIDVKLFDAGSLGVALQYQRIFNPQHTLQFVIPTVHFDALF